MVSSLYLVQFNTRKYGPEKLLTLFMQCDQVSLSFNLTLRTQAEYNAPSAVNDKPLPLKKGKSNKLTSRSIKLPTCIPYSC